VPFDLDEARLLAPIARPGSVSRTALVNRLRVSSLPPVVTLLAPAGYGKTTLLAQWAGRDGRCFAWVSMDEDDDDPLLLLRYVAAALWRAGRIDSSVLDAVGSTGRSSGRVVRLLTSALLSIVDPLVLVLDNVHLARSRQCAEVVAALAEHIPAGSTLVLAGRALPRLPVARLRASGRLLEIGAAELALSRREADLLMRGAGVELAAADVAELTDRTEGWAAGLYLAALSHPSEGDRFVADYFDFECLSRLSPQDVRFLTRTAVLESMCGPLCDMVLEAKGSARKLQSLERSNLFLVPLDQRRMWYRYHHEFRDFLRTELLRREPELVAALNRRAAAWCEVNGEAEAAISYAHAAGDVDLLARLVGAHALRVWSAGRSATVETWLGWFDDTTGLEKYPAIAVLGAWVHALRGRPAASERLLAVAESVAVEEALPDGSASVRPWIAVLRAATSSNGVEQMRSDAEVALQELGPASRWRSTALLLRGVAQLLLGDNERAEASMADAAEAAESVGATPSRVVALAEWSMLAAARGDEAGAETLAVQARALVGEHQLDDYLRSAIAFAVSARRELYRGNLERARAELEKAHALAPRLTHALPWYAVQTSLELARAHLALLDVDGAVALLTEADAILRRRPGLGVLAGHARELRAEVDRVAERHQGRTSTLTAAELRLLPLLATHLSFREIGEHLHVSRNTVKTQAISVYRKLGVSSRSEAIGRAVQLGLVDGPAAPSAAISSGRDDALPAAEVNGDRRGSRRDAAQARHSR